MRLTKKLIHSLIQEALDARMHAHAPYSRFRVGAALLAADGSVHRGCNIEISSFGLTCCAERTALFRAVADGHRRFEAIAVVADTATVPPCGMCRQALADFRTDLPVILATTEREYRVVSLETLLPEPFVTSHFHTPAAPHV
jgi:cytidine deaminase